jgi:hypothetical protein
MPSIRPTTYTNPSASISAQFSNRLARLAAAKTGRCYRPDHGVPATDLASVQLSETQNSQGQREERNGIDAVENVVVGGVAVPIPGQPLMSFPWCQHGTGELGIGCAIPAPPRDRSERTEECPLDRGRRTPEHDDVAELLRE